MELKVKEFTFPEIIEFNFDDLKKEISEKVSYYANLVYTEDQIKEAKADRAKLNKFVAALEDKRKEIKKQCLEPYETFEKKVKDLVAIVNEPILMIDGQVKAYEEAKKEDKHEEILHIWNDKCIFEWLDIKLVFNEKWLNASYKIAAIENEIVSKMVQISEDLATLAKLPEFSFEATEVYKTTLDINKAIQEGNRMAEVQKKKAEQQAEVEKHQPEIKEAAEKASDALMDDIVNQKNWISFSALLSTDDAIALREFFKERKIEFKAI